MPTIGVLSATFRNNSNGSGLTAWVAAHLEKLRAKNIDFIVLDSTNSPLPLGPVVDPLIAAGVKSLSDYTSPETQKWSQVVSSLSALVIVTPQYNWGYPGELKNALDHLFLEWKDLPVAIFSYGAHGGGKAVQQLREVMKGGLKTEVVSAGEVEISLPVEYIQGSKRVGREGSDEEWSAFLSNYDEVVDAALLKLAEAASRVTRNVWVA